VWKGELQGDYFLTRSLRRDIKERIGKTRFEQTQEKRTWAVRKNLEFSPGEGSIANVEGEVFMKAFSKREGLERRTGKKRRSENVLRRKLQSTGSD